MDIYVSWLILLSMVACRLTNQHDVLRRVADPGQRVADLLHAQRHLLLLALLLLVTAAIGVGDGALVLVTGDADLAAALELLHRRQVPLHLHLPHLDGHPHHHLPS